MRNIAESVPSVSKYGISGTTSNEEEMFGTQLLSPISYYQKFFLRLCIEVDYSEVLSIKRKIRMSRCVFL